MVSWKIILGHMTIHSSFVLHDFKPIITFSNKKWKCKGESNQLTDFTQGVLPIGRWNMSVASSRKQMSSELNFELELIEAANQGKKFEIGSKKLQCNNYWILRKQRWKNYEEYKMKKTIPWRFFKFAIW